MSPIRTILLWTSLVLTAAFAVLSVAGSLTGLYQQVGWRFGAHEFFNSMPVMVFWAALLASLVAGIVMDGKILFRPASLAMHMGPILVIVGAIIGSDLGHQLADRITGGKTVREGFMLIGEGRISDTITDARSLPAGKLPVSLRLNEFRVIPYPLSPASQSHWILFYQVAMGAEDANTWQHGDLDWAVGATVAMPGADLRVKVLEYIPSARAVWPEGIAGRLVIRAGGKTVELPSQVGQEARIDEPNAVVRIDQVYTRLVVGGDANGVKVVNDANSNENPGVSISIRWGDGTLASRYVLLHPAMHPVDNGGLDFKYVPTPPTAVADKTTQCPAMKVEFIRPEAEPITVWLIVPPGNDRAGAGDMDAQVWLARPDSPVQSYESNVTIQKDGQDAGSAVIRVNHPLHLAGYHLYQYQYRTDQEGHVYTELHAVSDAGLLWVWAGLALLCIGVFGHFWLLPITEHFRRAGHGD